MAFDPFLSPSCRLHQFLDQRLHFGLEPGETLAGGFALETRVNVFHQAVAADVDRRRVSAEIIQLRELVFIVLNTASVESRIGDAQAFGEGSDLSGVSRRVAGVFERERDYFQTP